jgi:hypothetical protein
MENQNLAGYGLLEGFLLGDSRGNKKSLIKFPLEKAQWKI